MSTLPLHCWDFHLSNSEDSEVKSNAKHQMVDVADVCNQPQSEAQMLLQPCLGSFNLANGCPTVRGEMPENVTEDMAGWHTRLQRLPAKTL